MSIVAPLAITTGFPAEELLIRRKAIAFLPRMSVRVSRLAAAPRFTEVAARLSALHASSLGFGEWVGGRRLSERCCQGKQGENLRELRYIVTM